MRKKSEDGQMQLGQIGLSMRQKMWKNSKLSQTQMRKKLSSRSLPTLQEEENVIMLLWSK